MIAMILVVDSVRLGHQLESLLVPYLAFGAAQNISLFNTTMVTGAVVDNTKLTSRSVASGPD